MEKMAACNVKEVQGSDISLGAHTMSSTNNERDGDGIQEGEILPGSYTVTYTRESVTTSTSGDLVFRKAEVS